MEIFEIEFSLNASGIIQIEANSKEEAIEIFNNMELSELFPFEGLHNYVVIEGVN